MQNPTIFDQPVLAQLDDPIAAAAIILSVPGIVIAVAESDLAQGKLVIIADRVLEKELFNKLWDKVSVAKRAVYLAITLQSFAQGNKK